MHGPSTSSIILVGGGTGGATTPLLAVAERLKHMGPDVTLAFIGTTDGPERDLVKAVGMEFHAIQAGKLRRYFSFQNVSDVVVTAIGFFQSLRLLRSKKPDAIITVGSFVAVPVVWAGKLLGIPCVVHQQDVVPGLANRLCAPCAHMITTAFEDSLRFFPNRKAVWTGNPVRSSIGAISREKALEKLGLSPHSPVLLVFGGGTGALKLNELIFASHDELGHQFQIVHITGGRERRPLASSARYRKYAFLTDEMPYALAAADIVVCRAGIGTLSELGVLGKPSIVIPLPRSHQEANASFFADRGACVALDECRLTPAKFVDTVCGLWRDTDRRTRMSEHVRSLVRTDAAQRVADVVMRVVRPRSLHEVTSELSRAVHDVRVNEPLSRHSNFKIGGPADVFVRCSTAREVRSAIMIVRRHDVQYAILGGGTNVVFSDEGFRGVIVQLRNRGCTVNGETVTAEAGLSTGAFIQQCHTHGLVGAEFLVGIYGTIGGAVRGNAGSFGKEMKDIVTSCDVLTERGDIETWPNDRLGFAYRESVIKHASIAILSVNVRLHPGDVHEAQRTMREFTNYKREHQPIDLPSAGCMFKNVVVPKGNAELRDRFSKVLKDDAIPAWALIKEAELAGKQIGDIQISEQHANFFVNLGNGTAEQIMMLKSIVKQRVRDSYGVQLEEEIQFIGW